MREVKCPHCYKPLRECKCWGELKVVDAMQTKEGLLIKVDVGDFYEWRRAPVDRPALAGAQEVESLSWLKVEAQSEGFGSVEEYVANLKLSRQTYMAERNSARDAYRRHRDESEARGKLIGIVLGMVDAPPGANVVQAVAAALSGPTEGSEPVAWQARRFYESSGGFDEPHWGFWHQCPKPTEEVLRQEKNLGIKREYRPLYLAAAASQDAKDAARSCDQGCNGCEDCTDYEEDAKDAAFYEAYAEGRKDQCAECHQDEARWRMLPAFLEKYQIDYVGLCRDIDAAIAQEGNNHG